MKLHPLAPGLLALALAPSLHAAPASPATAAPVTVTDNGRTWTLDNGIVKATVEKDTGFRGSRMVPR
jgi:hypothetical protein